MTEAFVPGLREPPPGVVTAEIVVAAPPELPQSTTSPLMRVLPIGMSVVTLGVMALAFVSGSTSTRNPAFLVFPVMMLVSMVLATISQRGRGHGGEIAASRADYLGYLTRLRQSVAETAAAQQVSLCRSHPDPATLWTLIGGARMWERRATDADFCSVRVGIGSQPLSTRLVAPEIHAAERTDPVTTAAVHRFIHTHATVGDVPIAIDLTATAAVTVDGDSAEARGLLRAMICQLAVLHPPDQLLIVGVVEGRNRADWDWLKWLPHNQHPVARDSVGTARMLYQSAAQAQSKLAGIGLPPRVVVIRDLPGRSEFDGAVAGMTILEAGPCRTGSPLTIHHGGLTQALSHPDRMDLLDAVICARRLAAYHVRAASCPGDDSGWPGLVGVDDVAGFDPIALWRSRDQHARLRAPIGNTIDGVPLELDIKEPAENGMGPHGLCVGATGSGKSELLRTVALGMMALNSPEVLNLLLIDFKGGATFLDLAQAPHVAAVITNLAEEAALVARMQDALAGEMNRRQQLLRTAGCASVAAYEQARRAGAELTALPVLFIIVDEFSELLSQHPDFADMFVAIGRLGRSLGMHLLLASQRLDEGRLRGLEAHLSYRLCLKTLSASESRIVLGTPDAYELPNTPGAGFLRSGSGELMRFQTVFVSGPLRAGGPARDTVRADHTNLTSVHGFTAQAVGPVARVAESDGLPAPTLLRTALDRLAGHGPAAHRVWLPPLGAAPPLDEVLPDAGSERLTVPIGIVDRPFEQCRTPMMVDLSGAAGNVAVVGAPRSGKSTVLLTLITALAATHDPSRVHFYCLDFGGGTLASLRALPHVGAIATRSEPRLVARMVAEIESIMRSREGAPDERGVDVADVFLVIDGWANLCKEFTAVEEPITAIAAQGLSSRVHVVLSASRWAEVRPSLRDQIGTRIELRLGDPADSELDRKRAREVPRDRPGRGLSHDGLHTAISRPLEANELRCRHGGPSAPPIPLLPTHVDYHVVLDLAGGEGEARILLGLEERRLHPVAVDFERNSHLLVLGERECGKTSTLRALCREIVRTKTAGQARLLIVDFRRTLLGVVQSQHLGGYALSPAALGGLMPDVVDLLRDRMPPPEVTQAQLRDRSWWSGPDIYIVVDDYDLVATPTGNPLLALLEYLPHARDLGLHVVAARRSGGAARGLFEPLLAGLREVGCMGLMMSARPDDGSLLGARRPERLPAGRGVWLTDGGDEEVIQVGWSPTP
ncbi:secretion protein EccC [Mycobacterium florentinum]|uniref:Secretion protein EccC n=1 Tax=Mycobacterium florentinum TaxID=292462 RepID=A0A1X1TYS6_MYCFL|nr:type VII secretion protein EccCa [Mycobacterium florentinum]MCV7409187.1 type VII secretion protein EccCa [Mycobacterium florentinum]ORV49725.1 secretion protein EccC [Mycobacterium florentinum]BBX78690.1 type VII secretion protein EccC [Mycobacterium florentinum]